MLTCCLEIPAEIPNKALKGNTRSEVASPEGMLPICIREEVISLRGIGGLFLLDGLDIVIRSRIFDFDSQLRLAIDVLDQSIIIFVPHVGVSVMEVFTQSMHQVCSAIVHGLYPEI